jgi:hypothetical protein
MNANNHSGVRHLRSFSDQSTSSKEFSLDQRELAACRTFASFADGTEFISNKFGSRRGLLVRPDSASFVL